MEKSSAFYYPRRFRIPLTAALLLLLTGCGANGTIEQSTPGLFNHYVVFPFSYCIQHFAAWFHDDYGLALIALTLLVRLALLPLMLRQSRNQAAMKQKMNAVQPELAKLKGKYGSGDAEAKRKLQQETMLLYQKHQINPLAMGCLPALIQLPILTGLYYAIKMTPELASHSFLWFQLGQPDKILPLLAALVYFLQFRVSQIGADPIQRKQMAVIGYLSPLMMGIFSFSAPAAVPLYWVAGGFIMLLQTALAKRLYDPKPEGQPVGSA